MATQPVTPPQQANRNITGFIISLVAGILLLLIGIIVMGYSITYHPPSQLSILPQPETYVPTWLKGTNPILIGALQTVCGITIVLGALMIFTPGRQRIGGSLVTATSTISIIFAIPSWIYIYGIIIGIIGGVQSLTKK